MVLVHARGGELGGGSSGGGGDGGGDGGNGADGGGVGDSSGRQNKHARHLQRSQLAVILLTHQEKHASYVESEGISLTQARGGTLGGSAGGERGLGMSGGGESGGGSGDK